MVNTVKLILIFSVFVIFIIVVNGGKMTNEQQVLDKCEHNETCVRICCPTCSDESFRKIKRSLEALKFNKNFKILRGNPCEKMITQHSWKLLPVSWCFMRSKPCEKCLNNLNLFITRMAPS